MPVFQYTARDMAGQLISETLPFTSESRLREYLRRNNLYVVEVAERQQRGLRGFRRGAGLGDLIVMTRQLRTMVNAGMPLVTGLESLALQTPNRYLAEVLMQVGRSVGHGVSLAATLAEYPQLFPPMLVALVRAGEEGGRLPESLQEAGRQFELQMELRQKLISATVYPLFTLCATLGTVIFMLLGVVPVFAKIYRDLNAPLPAVTQSVVWASDLLLHWVWLVLIALAAGVVLARRYYATPAGRLRVDAWKLRLPLVGSLFLKSATASLAGSLAGLVESGVPLIQALDTAATVCGNAMLADSVRRAARSVVLGRRLSDELEASRHFPLMVTRMLAIAEDVGTLPLVLREIANSYVQDVDYAIRRLLVLIEPVLVLAVGAVVGYVLVALYYPIFSLGTVFLKGS